MNRTLRIIIIVLLILFTPSVGIYKDGSGSYSLHAIMYDYTRVYRGYDYDTKTYSGPVETTFLFFPYNIIKKFSE